MKVWFIAEETHADGGKHFHAYLKYDRNVNTHNAFYFDHLGYHPNWTGVRQKLGGVSGWIRYLLKEDEHPLTSYTSDDIKAFLEGKSGKRNRDTAFHEALDLDTADLAYVHLLTVEPAHTITNSERIMKGLEDAYNRKITSRAFVYPGPIRIPDGWNPATHSLLIFGDAGLGKTQWAKSYASIYGRADCLFVRHVQDLALLKPTHGTIIFDDLDFSKFSDGQCKNITDVGEQCSVRILYKCARIPPGTVRIFTANHEHIFEDIHNAIYGRRLISVEFPF